METVNEKIQQIKQKLDNLRKLNESDDRRIELFSNIFELEASIPPKNEIFTCLIQKLRRDIEKKEFSEAFYDIQGWLWFTQRKPSTIIDYNFVSMIGLIKDNSISQISEIMKHNLEQLQKQQPPVYHGILDYYVKYPLWGSIEPDKNQYELFELRSTSLKEHVDDFVLLYSSFEDYRSKFCLISILLNWLFFDLVRLDKVKERAFDDYFDLDILQFDETDVIVDLGAFNGDTLLSYVNTYSNQYSKYYCYEMSKKNTNEIKMLVQRYNLKNIIIREVAVGKEKGQLFFDFNTEPSANKLCANGKISTDVVSIDEDIQEPITFIKMDIEGAEQDALLGCKKHIVNDHPRLAISVYHNNEDIWKIAKMIRGMDPTYKFYLRYNGGNAVPTETILFAV